MGAHGETAASVRDTRGDQMYPVLGAADLARLRHFGEPHHYVAGEKIARQSKPAGLLVAGIGGVLIGVTAIILGIVLPPEAF